MPATAQPNSAQRRSAERRKAFISKKNSENGRVASSPTLPGPEPGEPTQVDADMREADGKTANAQGGQRGQKRTTSETLAGGTAQVGTAAVPTAASVEPTVQKQRAAKQAAKPIGRVETTRLVAVGRCRLCGNRSGVRGPSGCHCPEPQCQVLVRRPPPGPGS